MQSLKPCTCIASIAMSRRKHVAQGMVQDVEAPKEGQHIVRVISLRGSNIVEAEFSDGRSTLCMMPNKFNKLLYVRKGGYLMIEEGVDAASQSNSNSKITATVIAVLYEEQIKELRKMPGAWPAEFEVGTNKSSNNLQDMLPCSDSDEEGGDEAQAGATDTSAQAAGGMQQAGEVQPASTAGVEGSGEEEEEDDDGLPPLEANTNRRVIVHYVSDDEDDEDDE